MKRNTQILTLDLFKRICASYEKALEFYKSKNVEKEDNLETFSTYIQKSFEKLNVVWDGEDFSKLYSFYLYIKDKLDVDFTNVAETSGAFYQFLKNAQEANFDVTDDAISFNSFVEETTVAESMDENTRKAMYSLFKLTSTNRKLFPKENEELLNALVDKKNNLNLRKMHRVRDFLIKKGGTLLTIALGSFFGGAIATTIFPAALSQYVVANPINNIITFGSFGLIAGGALAYLGIKLKNVITKLYYKKRYNAREIDLENLEDGLITDKDLRINKLIEKTQAVNAEILRLKQPLPEAKGLGKVKNAIVCFFRKVKRHALNIANRNRIHTISDELDIINARMTDILNSEVLTENEKLNRIDALQTVRNRIANIRAEELLDGIAQALASKKKLKIENLDIYARDTIISKKDRKDKKVVREKAKEILSSLLKGDISPLAGKYVFGGRVDLNIERNQGLLAEPKFVTPTAEQVIAMERERIARNSATTQTATEVVEADSNANNVVNETVAETIAEEETLPVAPANQTPGKLVRKTSSIVEKDIAVESTILNLLKDKNVIKDLFKEGFEPELLSTLTSELIKRQNPGVKKDGSPKARKRIRTTKFYKETEGIEELYTFLCKYNAEKAHVLTAEVEDEQHIEAQA